MAFASGRASSDVPPRAASIVAGLASVFNTVALNLCLVVASVTVVTTPLALSASTSALFRWRHEGDDAVLRNFFSALRVRPVKKSAALAAPIVAVGIGLVEVNYFLRYTGVIAIVCLAIGLLTFTLGLCMTACIALLLELQPMSTRQQLWSSAYLIAATSVWRTVPTFAAVGLVGVLGALIDPPLALICVPVLIVWMCLTAAVRAVDRAGVARLATDGVDRSHAMTAS